MKRLVGLLVLVWSMSTLVIPAWAEDADRFRPYFRFHSGDIEPLWGVDDHWSLGLGANLNRHVGVELAFDYYLQEWGDPDSVGEASIYNLVPEVRLRYPLFHDRLVPYMVAGIGPSWVQSKDVKSGAFDLNPDVEGYTFTAAVGAGLEYFIRDNVTFGVEARYLFVNPVDGTVGGRSQSVDLSATLFTFGLRVYFDENRPVPLASTEPKPTSQFYFGVRAGGDFLTDSDWVPGVELKPEQAAWGGVASQTGGLQLGVNLGRNFGVEIAGDHINHIVDMQGYDEVAEYGQGWIMANFRLRFPHKRWSPYVYLGPGVCYAELKDFKPAGSDLSLDAKGIYPAFNVGGGLDYFINRNFALNLDARWAYSWDNSFAVRNVMPESKGDLSHAAVAIGFKIFLFDL